MSPDKLQMFRSGNRGNADTTQSSGMQREKLISRTNSWAGMVRINPGMVSEWHHHGDYDSYIYMISGKARFDFGSEGLESYEAAPGDICYVPKGIVHRETNIGNQESVAFLVRVGSGELVFNVDGPGT